MSYRIQFSYIFNETLERVYECFSNYNQSLQISFKNLISKPSRMKGLNFDELGAEFDFLFKNYYNIHMVVSSTVNNDTYKMFTHDLTIKQLPIPLKVISSFYWNTCEKATIYTYEYEYNDHFFEALLKDEVTNDEKMKMCKNVEEYLKNSTRGLEQIESTIVNCPIMSLWNLMSNFEVLFKVCKSTKLKAVYHGDNLSIGTIIDVYTIEGNKHIGSMHLTSILMSEDVMEMQLESIANPIVVQKQAIRLIISKLNEKSCFLSVNHYALEYTPPGTFEMASKTKKKSFKDIKDYLEKSQ